MLTEDTTIKDETSGYESQLKDVQISDNEFRLFRDLVHTHTGIALSDAKKMMLRSRLQRRLHHLHITSFSKYYDYINNDDRGGVELREMINCITTNKTDFFREAHHFDFVRQTVIPEILAARTNGGGTLKLRVWHAGCSTGEEPYTLGMVLLDSLKKSINSWDIKLLASDIDTKVLDHAEAGIYERDKLDQVPMQYRSGYFLKGQGSRSNLVKVKTQVQDLITFRQINLLERTWPIKPGVKFDIIFCRNVVIYFDKPTQRTLFDRYLKLLKPGGYLIIGHSESLLGVSDAFESLGHTIYRAP